MKNRKLVLFEIWWNHLWFIESNKSLIMEFNETLKVFGIFRKLSKLEIAAVPRIYPNYQGISRFALTVVIISLSSSLNVDRGRAIAIFFRSQLLRQFARSTLNQLAITALCSQSFIYSWRKLHLQTHRARTKIHNTKVFCIYVGKIQLAIYLIYICILY